MRYHVAMNDGDLVDTLLRLYHAYYAQRVKEHPDWTAKQASFFDFLAWLNANRSKL